jgi:DNA-3-methyladenine glycosylase II
MISQINHRTLTETIYYQALYELTARDSDLADVVSRLGNPPFWTHPPGFSGIVLAILSQQVSLESAQATFTKLDKRIVSMNSQNFLSLDDRTLRVIGFSRQKASYIRGVALEIMDGEFNLEELESMEDDPARERLMKVRGIGAWTADTYLVFALRRSDAWPSGDLALVKAIQELRGLDNIPGLDEVERIANQWRPWRAVAARILWHHYLSERGRSTSA